MAIMTNNQVVEYLGLPDNIVSRLANEEGQTWTATANQFITTLLNKIVYSTVDTFGWDNPFKRFDGFPVRFGDTIENIYVETPEGYEFDKDATDPFSKKGVDVKTLYAKINYEMQYQATIQDTLLRRAALNEYGFMNLINSILRSLSTAKNVDEYFATIRLLNNPDLYANSTGSGDAKQFGNLDLTTYTSTSEQAEQLTKKIVDVVSAMQLPSRAFNVMGNLTASSLSDIILVIRRDLYNSINLDYLTGVFNLSKVDLIKNIIQVEDFRVKNASGDNVGENLGFIIMDQRAFDNHVALEDGGMIYNPKGKYTNHFLNLWKILAIKYFYNAVAYKVTV